MRSNPGGLVYGTITVGALLAAESAQRETYLETVGAVVIALVLYWLAHSYAEFTARRLEGKDPLTVGALAQTMAYELSILVGAAIPLLTLLVWWLVGARLASAVTAAIWAAAAITMAIEVAAALRAKETGRELVVQIAFGFLLGALVIAMMLVLHH
jgi:MFS family permease